MAEFASPERMLDALGVLRRGRYEQIETYTPFDLPEVDERLGLRRSRLGWLALVGGLIGLAVSYGIQWWANVHVYPLNVGGRPVHAVPAFIPATFEGSVLGAALALFAGLLVRLGLPRLWDPADEVRGFQRASADRFWIVVDGIVSDQDRANAEQLLREAGARRTVSLTAR
jgi:hypothetical protein